MGQSKNQIQRLNKAISSLEHKRENQYADLKLQLSKTFEYYKPINVIKENIKDIGSFAILKANILETAISLVGGYFSKKIVIGKSKTLTKKIIGYALHYAVSSLISKKLNSTKTIKNNYKTII
jgi:hypothetical protein